MKEERKKKTKQKLASKEFREKMKCRKFSKRVAARLEKRPLYRRKLKGH